MSESANPRDGGVITTDIVLVGAGIMSATLGALIHRLQPDWSISVFERLDAAAAESSDPWNNAGTGHSALCELNYTPQTADGEVDITKALHINEQFQVSRQFWANSVEAGVLRRPEEFINPIPHVSFVHGESNIDYLRKRYDKLAGETLFKGMEYITDPVEFTKRLPLIGRDVDAFVAAYRAYFDENAARSSTPLTMLDPDAAFRLKSPDR